MERYYNFGGEGVLAAVATRRAGGARSERAGRRLPRLDEGAPRSGPPRRADAALARSPLPADGDCSSPRRPTSCRRGSIGRACSRSSGAPTSTSFSPDGPGRSPFALDRVAHLVRLRRRVPIVARRGRTSGEPLARLHAAGDHRFGGRVHRRRPGARRRRARRARRARRDLHRTDCRTTCCRPRWPRPTSASRPFDPTAARAAAARVSTGRRSRSSSTWRPACPSSRPPCRA